MNFSYKAFLIPFLLLLFFKTARGQKINEDYVLKIGKISEKIILDGELSESIWETADVADNFSMILPQDDRKATHV